MMTSYRVNSILIARTLYCVQNCASCSYAYRRRPVAEEEWLVAEERGQRDEVLLEDLVHLVRRVTADALRHTAGFNLQIDEILAYGSAVELGFIGGFKKSNSEIENSLYMN
jgi:hypothetical protein